MSFLTNISPKADIAEGWKVIGVKDGKYFSVCMGFEYSFSIPIVNIQKKLAGYFFDNVLTNKDLFIPKMLGRTGVFLNKEDAERLVKKINMVGRIDKNFIIAIKRAVVSNACLFGEHGKDEGIVAGKNIRFLD